MTGTVNERWQVHKLHGWLIFAFSWEIHAIHSNMILKMKKGELFGIRYIQDDHGQDHIYMKTHPSHKTSISYKIKNVFQNNEIQ